MEKEGDIQVKYQKLATEYSKVRSQATVLKKAVLDEQTKIIDLNEQIKNLEQTVRIRDQEMESLLFRNDQLTKRIAVLQQELQMNTNTRKGKNKALDTVSNGDSSFFNEEFQKKIFENAKLLSSMAEKDAEINEYKEKLKNNEEIINRLNGEMECKNKTYEEKIEKLMQDKATLTKKIQVLDCQQIKDSNDANNWKAEVDRWRKECEFLKCKPNQNDQLAAYYESEMSKILETNLMLQSETKSVLSENMALKCRLENAIQEYNDLRIGLENSYEELKTTNNNYKIQLDAMTEHLASQNEKITRQCDEIQFLKHKLSAKK